MGEGATPYDYISKFGVERPGKNDLKMLIVWFNNRLGQVEETINALKDRAVEIIQLEKKKEWQSKESLRNIYDNIK